MVKPSEHTPLSALLLAEYATEAGLPAGTSGHNPRTVAVRCCRQLTDPPLYSMRTAGGLSVVLGGEAQGQQLVSDDRVEKISFTGTVGRQDGQTRDQASGDPGHRKHNCDADTTDTVIFCPLLPVQEV